jgi:hypothetical protein
MTAPDKEREMSERVTVVRWVDELETAGLAEAPVGGLGGWFGLKQPNTWQDYLDSWKEPAHPYIYALRASIVERGIRWGGDWHQEADDGTPVFSDGTVAEFSYRGWGDLLAAIWSDEDGQAYSYVNFYMGWPGEGQTPEGPTP